jgi:hypothetical protein
VVTLATALGLEDEMWKAWSKTLSKTLSKTSGARWNPSPAAFRRLPACEQISYLNRMWHEDIWDAQCRAERNDAEYLSLMGIGI